MIKTASKLLISTLLIFAIALPLNSQTNTPITVGDTTVMTLTEILAKRLTTVVIETVNQEEPTCEYVYPPAGSGCMGASITNATKVPGRMRIYKRYYARDSLLYDSGEFEESESGMTIKIRGNTSAFAPKKPYKIKLQKKKDLLFRGDEDTYKDKEWLLLKDDYLLTTAGFIVSELVGMTWVPGHRFVNVIINNDYKGVYLLCESVKRNQDCRLNVDKNTGYIFECDPYWWNEDVYVNSITSPKYNFTFKYHDSDEITADQLDYIQRVVTRYENSLRTENYPQYIDVESFAAWCLAHDILGTQDSGGSNRYYTKNDSTDDSKIVMPLVWDFDMCERTNNAWSNCHTDHMSQLFNNSNRKFVDAYAGLWRKLEDKIIQEFTQGLNDFSSFQDGFAVNSCFQLDKIVWGNTLSVYGSIITHKNWMSNRQPWMTTKIAALNPQGDTNVDGIVNMDDLTYLINVLVYNNVDYPYASDVNRDSVIGMDDLTYLINLLVLGN